MNNSIQHRDTMSNAHMRMYRYCLELAGKTDDRDRKVALTQEANNHLDTARHHYLMMKVCGNEYVTIR